MENKGTPNALIHETSPYLLQHAYNPVQWYPWGEEALQLAVEKDLPILVSIGYSACHWCHVMERESFENADTAAFMNHHFINIKIDREERPDLDHIYMDAVQAISGSGGWPLNVFLTPGKKPFYGGTYFPPKPAFNRPSWMDVLYSMSEYWKNKREEVEQQADGLMEHLQNANDFGSRTVKVAAGTEDDFYNRQSCKTIADAILVNADREEGGFGRAPKFLQTFSIQYLLQYALLSGKDDYKEQALLSLRKMVNGGIYDQLGGGISRYSTDTQWLVPHFEKMLYDNALLTIALSEAYQLTGEDFYRRAIEHTLQFVSTGLQHSEGGYYTALDADSEGVEGKYYVWQKEEIEHLLGTDAALFCDYYNVKAEGNWEHANILNVTEEPAEVAARYNITAGALDEKLAVCRNILLAQREQRIAPGLDDKILLNCNALLLKAFCVAHGALQKEEYKTAAINLYTFIETRLKAGDGSLFHTYKQGIAKVPAFLDDYAYYIEALISLHEITADTDYLLKAREYTRLLEEGFTDEEQCYFYYTHRLQADIVVRKKELYDGATPSANAVMCSNLYYLATIFDQPAWRERAGKMLRAIYPAMQKYAGSFARWGLIYLRQSYGEAEIVLSGNGFETVLGQILKEFIPNKVIMAAGIVKKEGWPMLEGKAPGSPPLIYLCRNYSCQAPVFSINDLLLNIKSGWKE
ncbi:MAG: thioredoxin domain-containing protein [Ferruginibacter sp.]